jgi:hypothetical protein
MNQPLAVMAHVLEGLIHLASRSAIEVGKSPEERYALNA